GPARARPQLPQQLVAALAALLDEREDAGQGTLLAALGPGDELGVLGGTDRHPPRLPRPGRRGPEPAGQRQHRRLERPAGVPAGLAGDVGLEQRGEGRGDVVGRQPARELKRLPDGERLRLQRGGRLLGGYPPARRARPQRHGLREQRELPRQRRHDALRGLAVVEELPGDGQRPRRVALRDRVDEVEGVPHRGAVRDLPDALGGGHLVQGGQLVHLREDRGRVLAEQLGQRRRHVALVAQAGGVELALHPARQGLEPGRGGGDVGPERGPALLPGRRGVGVDGHDQRGVRQRGQRRHQLLARPDPRLPSEGRAEVEQERDLAEEPALGSELRDLGGFEPFPELGDVGALEAALCERALGRAAREERVAAEREDHAASTTASTSARSSAAVAWRASGSRDSARSSTASYDLASSGSGARGTRSSPARYLTTWPPYGGWPESMW